MNVALVLHSEHRSTFAALVRLAAERPADEYVSDLLAAWRGCLRDGDGECVLACVEDAERLLADESA